MNLTESLALLRSSIDDLSVLNEAKGHLDHPEDLVFLGGSQGANDAVNAIVNTVKKPKTITIKWDGYPALYLDETTTASSVLWINICLTEKMV